MVAITRDKFLTAVLVFPLALFLTLTALSYGKGRAGRWTSKATELFLQHRWSDVVSLAENLHRTGSADAQTLLLAAMSADYLGSTEQTTALMQQLLHKDALNLALETSASAVYQQPPSLLDRLKLYRSRLTLLLLSLITFLVVLSVAQKKKRSVLIGAISATGCVLLLL